MASPCTDTFSLNKNPLFERLRKCLPANERETQNLIVCQSNMIYAWDSKDCCVLAFNWRALHIDPEAKVKVQKLELSKPLYFVVNKITISTEGTLLSLSGNQGVSILELPQVWSSQGMFHDGRETVLCKVHNLDELLFINNVNLQTLQVRFHPASPNDSHLLVLLSDNTIRLYNEFKLSHIWRVGPEPVFNNSVSASMLSQLGDTAVDFDIAPPRIVSQDNLTSSIVNMSLNDTTKSTKQVEWPLVVLRGNGMICILCAGIDTAKPQLQGPLKMIPQSEDNYGTDSCSLIVIPSAPPTLVIAESTGKLYHCLLLKSTSPDDSFNEEDEYYVQVLEAVELDLGLQIDTTVSNNCPIFLKRDIINECRYYAYHNTGLHTVSVEFVRSLKEFLNTDDENSNFTLNPSRAEYLICTKALKSTNVNAILGFFLPESPNGLAIFLSSGQVVSQNITADPAFVIPPPSSLTRSIDTPNKSENEPSNFDAFIRNILNNGVTHPLLMLDKTVEPTTHECLQLLLKSTKVLREQYFPRYEQARNEIEKRVKFLRHLKEQQQAQIEDLQSQRAIIYENAERFSDMYEDISDRQQVLFRRAQQVVRIALERLPHATLAEKEFGEKIEKMAKTVANLHKSIDQTLGKMQKQELHVSQYVLNGSTKKVFLPDKQHEMISDILKKMNGEINSLATDVKDIQQNIK